MRKLPKLTRKRDLFSKKFIITVPPWGPPVVAVAIIISSVAAGMQQAITAVSLLLCLASAIFCRVAWLHLKEMRYALHNAINDIENEDQDSGDLEDTVYPVPGMGEDRDSA